MENRVLIFGDSYADPKGSPSYTWHKRLKEKYYLKGLQCSHQPGFHNYGESGTGSQHAFEHFYDNLSGLNKNDILIFLLSDSFRINFFGGSLFKKEVSAIKWDNVSKKSYCVFEEYPKKLQNNKHVRILDYYKQHENQIDFLYRTYEKELAVFNIKNISFLYALSKAYGFKVIVFEIFPVLQTSELSSRYNDPFQLIKSDDSFHLCKEFLSEISRNEIIDEELNLFDDSLRQGDRRSNHFSEENHKILYNYIEYVIRSFETTLHPDDKLPEFKQHFKRCESVYNIVDHKEKFIYE
jgi:hypothetical protein